AAAEAARDDALARRDDALARLESFRATRRYRLAARLAAPTDALRARLGR
ncbi:MAG: hypothetical protein H0V81_00055, partial [Solirubrobacterales bacterium]|nr:hypothetical protein [Solirubrobacterales bacterium]